MDTKALSYNRSLRILLSHFLNFFSPQISPKFSVLYIEINSKSFKGSSKFFKNFFLNLKKKKKVAYKISLPSLMREPNSGKVAAKLKPKEIFDFNI